MKVYDEFYTNQKRKAKYPYLEVLNPSDALPVFLSSTRDGDLPITAKFKGRMVEVGEIERNIDHIEILLKCFNVALHISEQETKQLNNINELIELGVDINPFLTV